MGDYVFGPGRLGLLPRRVRLYHFIRDSLLPAFEHYYDHNIVSHGLTFRSYSVLLLQLHRVLLH